jgi:para-aminobenzoate synthetase component 1
MLRWAGQRNIFCFLDNQQYGTPHGHYECLLAAGAAASCSSTLHGLDLFLQDNRGWVFGHLSYELKNIIHGFEHQRESPVPFPPFFFFVPEHLFLVKGNGLTIKADDPDAIFREVSGMDDGENGTALPVQVQERISREDYLAIIEKLRQHILRGDCYEINFCQEFFSENADIDPVAVFERLMEISPNPFSALYRYHSQYLVCASPERFLMKQGSRLLSQPIKGTIRRDRNDAAGDLRLKAELEASAKDRAENVMVVDLVRNDLSRVCREGSVGVDELFGVYAYPQVYQMISTISGELREDVPFSSILQATFPMGSMTGAPKHRVMELIDRYEASARGIFSGSIGYFNPEGGFDFNVVIRSIMYNAASRYLTYQVGSGITFYSDPQKEWEECLLKAEAIKKVLTGGRSAL